MTQRYMAAMAAGALLAMAAAAQAQAPWYPSKWGPNDELGAANYLTPAVALEAAKLVKTGKTYALGITVTTSTPAYPPRTCAIYIVQPGQTGSAQGLGPTNTTNNDDILNCWTGIAGRSPPSSWNHSVRNCRRRDTWPPSASWRPSTAQC